MHERLLCALCACDVVCVCVCVKAGKMSSADPPTGQGRAGKSAVGGSAGCRKQVVESVE